MDELKLRPLPNLTSREAARCSPVLRLVHRADEPPLSPDELRRIRALLDHADKIAHGCPMARRILEPE